MMELYAKFCQKTFKFEEVCQCPQARSYGFGPMEIINNHAETIMMITMLING